MRRRLRPSSRRKRKLFLGIVLGIGLLAGAMFQLDSRLRPIVIELAEVQLDNQVAEMVNQVCQDLEEGGQLTYNDIMQVVYDQDGQVIAMEADTDTINLLRTKLGNEVATGLGDMERQLVSVPIGTACHVPLLSGLGPVVSVEILHIGQVNVSVISDFQTAGINQTLHQIKVEVSVEVLLLMPGGTVKQQQTTTIPLAESILLGKVPSSYISLDSASDSRAVS